MRLGMREVEEPIREERFFQTIDWIKLEKKQIEPPFKPEIVSLRICFYQIV